MPWLYGIYSMDYCMLHDYLHTVSYTFFVAIKFVLNTCIRHTVFLFSESSHAFIRYTQHFWQSTLSLCIQCTPRSTESPHACQEAIFERSVLKWVPVGSLLCGPHVDHGKSCWQWKSSSFSVYFSLFIDCFPEYRPTTHPSAFLGMSQTSV